jgi:hypothetical protein
VGSLVTLGAVAIVSLALLIWALPGVLYNVSVRPPSRECLRELTPFGWPAAQNGRCLQLQPNEPSRDFPPVTDAAGTKPVGVQLMLHAVDLVEHQLDVRAWVQSSPVPSDRMELMAASPCAPPCQPVPVAATQPLTPEGAQAEDALPPRVDLRLPIVGDPRQFPGDLYLLDMALGLWRAGPSGAPAPLLLSIAIDDGMADYDVFLLGSPAPAAGFDEVRLVLLRNGYEQVAVYAVLAVPLILGIVLMHVFFLSHLPSANFATDFLIPLAGLMLTILPLRSVLVPAQIGGTTRIDYVLGYEALILLAFAIVAYAVLLVRRRRAYPPTPRAAGRRERADAGREHQQGSGAS